MCDPSIKQTYPRAILWKFNQEKNTVLHWSVIGEEQDPSFEQIKPVVWLIIPYNQWIMRRKNVCFAIGHQFYTDSMTKLDNARSKPQSMGTL